MGSQKLPEDVYNFVKKYISSIELLEILLLLHRDPDRSWSVSEISREIRSSITSAQHRVRTMLSHGLIQAKPGADGETLYSSQKTSTEVHILIDKVETEYRIRRMAVIDCIYSPPAEKILDFLDAFKIRKSDKDE